MRHTAMYNDYVELEINEKGVLCAIRNYGKPCDVIIPHMLPSGKIITCIGRNFLYGKYKLVTISNEITDIAEAAFQSTSVEAVAWSAGCKNIPARCFHECSLKKLVNIANVTKIGSSAFMDADIENIIWPENCKLIPQACFERSRLQNISGIECVTHICTAAFSECKIKEIVWPSGCSVIPYECFYRSKLERIGNAEHVTAICEKAFAYSQLQALDLSGTAVNFIGKQAFAAIGQETVIPPYYTPKDVWDSAFRN